MAYQQTNPYAQQQPGYGAVPQQQQPAYGQQQPMYVQNAGYQQTAGTQQTQLYDANTGQPIGTVDSAGAVLVSKPGRFAYSEGQYRDVAFMVLFLLHLVAMAVICAVYATPLVNESSSTSSGTVSTGTILIFVTAAMTGAVWAAFWLEIMKLFAGTLIRMSLTVVNVLLAAAVIVCFAYGQIELGVFYILFMLLSLLYFFLVRHRIPFAQETLRPSCVALTDHRGPIWVTYFVSLLEVGWFAFWAFTFCAVWYDADRKGKSINSGVVFLLLISLYWTAQVLMNVGHVTTAGVVASWWFQPNSPSPTMGAFKRACTTSFGSICFGSLIVAVLQAMRAMVRSGRGRGGFCVIWLLRCIENIMRYFNLYAFTQVAIYGKDFRTAAADTWDLFMSQGFTLIINDDLTGMVLALGNFLGGAAAAAVAALWSSVDYPDTWWAFAILGFFLGYIMSSLFMTTVKSAVATTLVCWAEDPAAVAANRPDFFQAMRAAALLLYPNFGSPVVEP